MGFYIHRVIPATAGIHAEGQPQQKGVWREADVDSGLRRNVTEKGDGSEQA
jgi:hypothetical protein